LQDYSIWSKDTSRKGAFDEAIAKGRNAQNYVAGITSLVMGTFSTSEKRTFLMPYKIGLTNFESSWLKFFTLHKVEAFDMC
jgi:hypothetical protein